MKMNDKAEALISEFSELLWDNNMKIVEYEYIMKSGGKLFAEFTDDDDSDIESVTRGSIALLYTHLKKYYTLFWLRKLIASAEELIRVEGLTDSVIGYKRSEAFEAVRSRVLVKAIHAGFEHEAVFKMIAETASMDELLGFEKQVSSNNLKAIEPIGKTAPFRKMRKTFSLTT